MVVQTLRMKIQESSVACDPAGRIGSGEVHVSEPDCEDVPRLDMKALTEDSGSWGGEAGGSILLFMLHLSIIQLTLGVLYFMHAK